MNHARTTVTLLIASLALCFYLSNGTQAQNPSPSPTPENPFAPETAPALPPGMTGSDTSDPRASLTPGMYDAGEAALGLKHLLLLKTPDAFQLGADNPDDPKVQKTLGLLGIGLALRSFDSGLLRWAATLVLLGIVLFSGSLYALTFGAPRMLGAVTPVGGLAMIAGWLAFAAAALRL